ncbi:MAG TPA: hypothetical protein VIK95_12060 [Egibacteraceae bacterium]
MTDLSRTRGGTTGAVVVGSVVTGLAVYVFQALGTHALGDEGYAPIGVLWTIQYLVMTVALLPVETYLGRLHASSGGDPRALPRAVARFSAWIGGVAVLLGAAAWVFRGPLFGGAGDMALLVAVIVVSYGMLTVIRGHLVGRERFVAYAVVTGLESVVRIVVALPLVVVAPSTRGLAWTLPVGALGVAAWWLLSGARRSAGVSAAAGAPPAGAELGASAGRYLLATTAANAAAQTLLAAGPLVLIALGASAAEVSVFFVVATAARVPLVFAFGGLLSRVLPPLTALARDDRRRMRSLVVAIGAATPPASVVAGLAGALVGPAAVALLFGAVFRPDPWLAATVTAGVVLATGAQVVTQCLIAMGAETRLVLPWTLALVAGAAAVVALPGGALPRTAVAVVVGETAAVAGLVAAALRAGVQRPRLRVRYSVVSKWNSSLK